MSKIAVAVLCALCALSPGCRRPEAGTKPSITTPDGATFSRGQLLDAFGQCALSTYRSFATASDELASATTKLAAENSDANVRAARAAWERAIDLWQQAELMQIGPAKPPPAKSGKDLRNSIYAFGNFNRCITEQVIDAKQYEDPSFLSFALISGRTLTAAEYLLFYEGTDNACAPTAGINSSGSWARITDLPARKHSYAKVLAGEIPVHARALVDAWDPAKGRFLTELATAGAGSTLYSTDIAALNIVSDAMFYLDYATKDAKLAKPLGICAIPPAVCACPTPPCLDLAESPFAKRGKQHIRNNLVGFRKLLTGCNADFSGLGFDDLLGALGASALAKRLDDDTVAAIAAVDALSGTLEDAFRDNPAAARKIYDAVKKITDALKTEFVSVLNLELPVEGKGDSD